MIKGRINDPVSFSKIVSILKDLVENVNIILDKEVLRITGTDGSV
jgi:hypothetical protein